MSVRRSCSRGRLSSSSWMRSASAQLQVDDADAGVQPGQQLDAIERLRHEVVGAGLERRAPDRHGRPRVVSIIRYGCTRSAAARTRPHTSTPSSPGMLQSRMASGGASERGEAEAGVEAVADRLDLVPPLLERSDERELRDGLVFRHENLHVVYPSGGSRRHGTNRASYRARRSPRLTSGIGVETRPLNKGDAYRLADGLPGRYSISTWLTIAMGRPAGADAMTTSVAPSRSTTSLSPSRTPRRRPRAPTGQSPRRRSARPP